MESSTASTEHSTSAGLAPTADAVLGLALDRLAQCLAPTAGEWSQRQRLVEESLKRLQQSWKSNPTIRILPFGSTLSGLCLADSDIDLGLFGTMSGCELEALNTGQAKKLLFSVLGTLQRARLSDGKIQTVLGARVPVLKYKCALSGLDCDISIQGTGALVKAHFMQILCRHCPALSPLYRLVKCWAAAHDLNDASRSTFNSTSLLYLTIFYLQTQQLAPPIKDLVDVQQLCNPACRLLHLDNKSMWSQQQHLDSLLTSARQRAAAWASQQRCLHDGSWQRPVLARLLKGFFAFYSELMTDWLLAKRRDVYADLWAGQLTSQRPLQETLSKHYLFNLQDPFDAVDCPARAIGTLQNNNNNVATLIVHLINCSSVAIERFYEASRNSSSSPASSSSSSSKTGERGLRQGLCQCLAWLFGPQVVLHLARPLADPFDSDDDAWSSAAGSAAAARIYSTPNLAAVQWRDWAVCPFEAELCNRLSLQLVKLKGKQQERSRGRGNTPLTPASLFRWLVAQLHAAVEADTDQPVLCLEHLHLLNKRIEAGQLKGALGTALGAAAAERCAAQQQQRQQLEEQRWQWQLQRLPGPPLPQADARIMQLATDLQARLAESRWQPPPEGSKKAPDSMANVIKDAVKKTVVTVAQILHSSAAAPAAPDALGIGGFGLLAVLQQHGFIEMLQPWNCVQDGGRVVWPKMLPLPEHLQQRKQSTPLEAAAAATAAVAFAAAAAAPLDAPPVELSEQDMAQAKWAAAAAVAGPLGSKHAPAAAAAAGTGVYLAGRQQQRQAQQQLELQSELEVHTRGTRRAKAVNSSVTVSGLQENMKQLTVEVGTVQAAARNRHDRGPAQGGQQKMHNLQQKATGHGHGHQRGVQAQAHAQHQPGHDEQHGNWQQQQQQDHHHHMQLPYMPGQGHQHHQQHSHHSPHTSTGPEHTGVRVLPRPRPLLDVALPDDPFGCHSVQAYAMHGDGLAESYCRQLQEKLSPSATKPQGSRAAALQQPLLQQQQQQHGHHGGMQQLQLPEPCHPAAELLGRRAPFNSQAAGVAGVDAAMATSPPAVTSPGGVSSSTPASKARQRLQKASYKVKQLQQQEAKVRSKISAREKELQQWHSTMMQLLASAGPEGEEALSPLDRARLREVKQGIRGAKEAHRMLANNMDATCSKLSAALQEVAEAEAAVTAAEHNT